jgi:hypothetical protein
MSTALPLDPKIAQEISRVRAHAPQLESSPVGLPILVKSERESGSIRREVYSIVSQPFEVVRDELGSPRAWCEVLPLHFNVKACTYTTSEGLDKLGLHLGRKSYQPIARARVLEFGFIAAPAAREFLDVRRARRRVRSGRRTTRSRSSRSLSTPIGA